MEYLRDTNSRACNEVGRLPHDLPTTVVTTEPVAMELSRPYHFAGSDFRRPG